jgi:hypothetical protein
MHRLSYTGDLAASMDLDSQILENILQLFFDRTYARPHCAAFGKPLIYTFGRLFGRILA